ncbi:iron(III) transport system permease protein [Mesocricetibacter intestinalis]|uniref:Iron(III) transport system permease protein n=1 Tax=Mesocricetibacter intestinalis TaxID=1521930 RepID=A0A4R6V6J9_9PAST|nr:iron ABC transporter permease [Mesocricetibacter intestinalis]TDQ56408.1 iron(III) transport system permease protein [Mesocricetibacter intestinalis]
MKRKKIRRILTALFIVIFFTLPLAALLFQSLQAENESLAHLWRTLLLDYSLNSLLLVCGTVILSLIFALPCAWIVSNFTFREQKILQWLLCLPLAMPAYLIGYLYTDLLDYSGPVQSLLRDIFGWKTTQDYWFPTVRSLGGACCVLALALYPYIFLLARIALLELPQNLHDSARLFGLNLRQRLLKLVLPFTRPAIAVGASLVAMETLGDFGTVAYFALPTLTTAIYDTWLGYGDLGSASRISLLMLLFILIFILAEAYSRRRQKIYQRGYEQKTHIRRLRGSGLWFARLYCWGLITAAFFIPVAKLLYWAIHYFEAEQLQSFLQYAYHSLLSSIGAATICVLLALLLHFIHRSAGQQQGLPYHFGRLSLQLSGLGYALPGTVLAIGILIVYTRADHVLNAILQSIGLPSLGLLLSGSVLALISAYVIRFSAMALGSIQTALNKIPPALDMAGRSLGCNDYAIFRRIQLPLLGKGILTAFLLVFIESMKELNASLLLRPFNFDTLATYVFAFTSDEQLEQAALPALWLICVGLIPVIWLTRSLLLQAQQER